MNKVSDVIPGLNGLVLTGGGSRRMGFDKAGIHYQDKPHALYLFQILSLFCEETYISCRMDQRHLWRDLPVLVDEYEDIGPMAAFFSAFKKRRNAGWLIVGCDYPLINKSVIEILIKGRDTSFDISFLTPSHEERYQPLLAIWEKTSLRVIEEQHKNEDFSLRNCMRKLRTHAVQIEDANILFNANTPSDMEEALNLLKNRDLPKNNKTS